MIALVVSSSNNFMTMIASIIMTRLYVISDFEPAINGMSKAFQVVLVTALQFHRPTYLQTRDLLCRQLPRLCLQKSELAVALAATYSRTLRRRKVYMGQSVQGLSCNRVVAAELPSGRMAIKTSQVAHADLVKPRHLGVLADPCET